MLFDCSFLSCFPRTFEIFGPANAFVRLVYKKNLGGRVNDNMEMVMVNIARMPYQALRHALDRAVLKN